MPVLTGGKELRLLVSCLDLLISFFCYILQNPHLLKILHNSFEVFLVTCFLTKKRPLTLCLGQCTELMY